MDPGQQQQPPPSPHSPHAPRPRASPWHLAGFTFGTADPMYTDDIRQTLQHATFMPRRKAHGDRDSILRYQTNLRFIFEAAKHFGDFWGRRDFWPRILELLKFPPPTTPEIIQDIVKRYCLARLECCDRISTRTPHDFKIRAPNRIAELADEINNLYRHDPEYISSADWKRKQLKWGGRLYRVLYDQGVHAAQLADRTCAPELLDDRPASRSRPPPFSPAASDSDRTAPIPTSPSLNPRRSFEMVSARDATAPDCLQGPRLFPAVPSTNKEGSSKTMEASTASIDGGDKAETETESRTATESGAPVETGAQVRVEPAAQSLNNLLASFSTPAAATGTPPVEDTAPGQKRVRGEDPDDDGLSRKRLATEVKNITIKDKARDEYETAPTQIAQASPQPNSSDPTDGISQQRLPAAPDVAMGGQVGDDANLITRPTKEGPGDATQTADMVQDLLMSLEKRQRNLEKLEASMKAMQTELARHAAENTRVEKLENQLKQLQHTLDNRMVDTKRVERLHETVEEIKQLSGEPNVKLRLDEMDSAVYRIQRQVAGQATTIGQVGRIQSDMAALRAEQSKRPTDRVIFKYVDDKMRTAEDRLMEKTQGSILKLGEEVHALRQHVDDQMRTAEDRLMEKTEESNLKLGEEVQALRQHVDEQRVAAARKDTEDPRVTEVQNQLSEIQEQLRRHKTAVNTPSPLENALLEGLDAHKFIDRTTYELAKTRTALRAKVREMDAAGVPDNEPKLILSEISWEISQILEVARKRIKRLHESETNGAVKGS